MSMKSHTAGAFVLAASLLLPLGLVVRVWLAVLFAL